MKFFSNMKKNIYSVYITLVDCLKVYLNCLCLPRQYFLIKILNFRFYIFFCLCSNKILFVCFAYFFFSVIISDTYTKDCSRLSVWVWYYTFRCKCLAFCEVAFTIFFSIIYNNSRLLESLRSIQILIRTSGNYQRSLEVRALGRSFF